MLKSNSKFKIQNSKLIDIPCVILSGGKSSRMGEDKSLLPFEQSNIIQYQYQRLKNIFSKVYISAKTNKFDFQADIILDNSEIYSPLVALQSILTKFKSVFIITVDNPFITAQTIHTLVNNSDNFDITIALTPNKIHNLCGVFKNSILENITNNIKQHNHKIGYLIKNQLTNTILFDDEKEFLNINTKEQYNQALKHLI